MITAEELDIVLDCARHCARHVPWPNEVAVYDWVVRVHSKLFSPTSLEILKFCAEEVEHQQEGAVAVACYFDAWKHAMERHRDGYALNLQTLNELAAKIEPDANAGGRYRKDVVTIRGMVTGTSPADIPGDMQGFEVELQAYLAGERTDFYGRPLTAERLYEMFEVIHPRQNGNGREGKIIFNWVTGRLANPVFPEEPARFRS